MSDNADMPFESECDDSESSPLDKPYFTKPTVYHRKRPKQRVFLFDGSTQSAGNLNELLDKNWRLTQQLEPQLGVGSHSGRSLYLLEWEGE